MKSARWCGRPVADRREILILGGVGVAAAAIGVLAAVRLAESPPVTGGDALRAARLTDLSGKLRSLAEWDGRVLVCNFWATWCPPCREEIPELVRARDKFLSSGVEFLGIALDQADKVSEFARSVRISYPVLLADAAGVDLVRQLGNPTGGLPFTVILDPKGSIVFRKIGTLTQQEIEDRLAALLRT